MVGLIGVLASTVIVLPARAQHESPETPSAWPTEAELKGDGMQPLEVSATAVQNSALRLTWVSTGQFTLQTADGRYLIYPNPRTSFLSVSVDGNVSTNLDGTLTVATTPRAVTSDTVETIYRTPQGVRVIQRLTLRQAALEISLAAEHTSAQARTIAFRLLLDTQVDINDGSPLYTPLTNVRTTETTVPPASFGEWRSYDRWPEPRLTGVGTLPYAPDPMMLVWWPSAVQTRWNYTPVVGRHFFTPGFTQSPQSDSAALLFFKLGAVPPGEAREVRTFYGTAAPTFVSNRERLIAAFSDLRDASRAAVLADLDAFAALQATYYARTRLSEQDIVSDVWAALELSYDLARWRVRGSERLALLTARNIIQTVALGADLGRGLSSLADRIPANATEEQIRSQYIRPTFLTELRFGEYQGVAGVIAAIDADYVSAVANIPEPLPASYPVESVIQMLRIQAEQIRASTRDEVSVAAYTRNMCSYPKLGVLQVQKRFMEQLAGANDLSSSVSFATTVSSMGSAAVMGFSAVKIATIMLSGGTVGAVEFSIWGGAAAVNRLSGLVGAGSSVGSLTTFGLMSRTSYEAVAQLGSDLALRRAVLKGSGEHVVLMARPEMMEVYLAAAEHVRIDRVEIPDLVVLASEAGVQGEGRVVVTNTDSTVHSVSVHGNLTTALGEAMPIVGLLHADPVVIPPGEQRTISFSYTVLRSTLLQQEGYFVHLLLASAAGSIVQFQGPRVAHFFAGTTEQLATLRRQTMTPLEQGEIAPGAVRTRLVPLRPGMRNARVMLSFQEGADQDLHLYDARGRHVGLNYATGQIERQIPGVTYSGPSQWPEWIALHEPVAGTYEVRVVGQSNSAGSTFDLSLLESPALPGLLDAPPQIEWPVYRQPGGTTQDTYTFSVPIREGGGSALIEQLAVSFEPLSESGAPLSHDRIICRAPTRLAAGTGDAVTCAVTVPSEMPSGTYTGRLLVSGRTSTGATVAAATLVTLRLVQDVPVAYLPWTNP
jgi:hypothetical protein